jgi:plastocyanin
MINPLILLAILIIFVPQAVFAGTLRGVVKFTGPPPIAQKIKTGKFKKICGPEMTDDSFLLSKQGVQNAVVAVQGIKASSAPANVKLDQKNCRFEPHILLMAKGSKLNIHTSDPLQHNLHTYSFENDPFNLMLKPGQDFSHEFESPEIIKLECDLHGWMTAWFYVADNPFLSLSKTDGSFEIRDVPTGTYSVKAWHEVLGDQTQKVQVGDGVTEVVFEFNKIPPKASAE